MAPRVLAMEARVSIRSRLFGREKRWRREYWRWRLGFQSAPGFSAGRNRRRGRRWRDIIGFQSAPGFSAGRNAHGSVVECNLRMFQSAPGFSAGRNRQRFPHPADRQTVSIRSRLFGREKPSARGPCPGRCARFNPLPAFRPGETQRLEAILIQRLVSIRSRLFGREKPRASPSAWGRWRVSIRSRLFGREKLRFGNHWPPKRICRALREPRNKGISSSRSRLTQRTNSV